LLDFLFWVKDAALCELKTGFYFNFNVRDGSQVVGIEDLELKGHIIFGCLFKVTVRLPPKDGQKRYKDLQSTRKSKGNQRKTIKIDETLKS